MLKVNQALVVFTLFVAQRLARSQVIDALDEWKDQTGIPAPGPTEPFAPTENDCRKDLIIMIDASNSIGVKNFNRMKMFFKDLINDKQLNVGPNGTHIAIMTFSTEGKTRVRLEFGEKTTREELIEFIKSDLIYDELKGVKTRTGYAFELVNKIFTKPSPGNVRKDIADVVMLVTDGEPRGGTKGYETKRAIDQSGLLKGRDILIVGIAINPEGEHITRENKKEFKDVIMKITTKPEDTFDVEFNDLKSIVNKLVSASCINHKAGDCSCDTIGAGDMYAKPGKTKALVHWTQPTLKCKTNLEIIVQNTQVAPDIKSPRLFDVGSHKISYTYTIKSGEGSLDIEPCTVEFTVVSCDCATASTRIVSLKSGNSKATVDWTVPKPPETCLASLIYVTPANVSPGHSFSFGKHTVKYVYKTKAGDVTCNVNIDVQGELCGGKAYNSKPDVCCCGSSYEKKVGFECCGKFYHNTRNEKCCKNANLVGIRKSCPGE